MTLIAGSILQNGRYVIQSVISQGKIDITYAAKHTYLDQAVRIKTLQPRLRSHYEDINVQEEFTRRAARFARCSNPHLVRVIDGFEEDWMPFLVLKTVPGIGLAQQLPDISLPQTLAIMRQLVPAVQFLHDQNLVHGNICLDNIVGREESAPKTLDIVLTSMGLRSFVPSLRQSLDEEYPDLLSPQADLQALTVVLCELLTGQPQSLSALQSPETLAEVRSRYSQLPDSLDPILAEGLNPTEGQSVSSWFAQLEPSLTQPLESVVPTASAEPQPLLEHDETAATLGDSQPDLDASAPQNALLTPLKISPEPTPEPAYSEVGDSSSGNSATMTATHQSSHSGSPQATQTRSPQRSWKLPIALGLTSLVAAVGGGYFGLNFRLQEPEDLERSPIFGSEMFGSEQSFPASDRWPGESDYEGRTSPLFETPNTLNYSQPSALELDVPSTTPSESYQSEPRQVEPSQVEEEEEYNFQEDVNLGTDTKTFPEEDFSGYEQEPAANAEGDRPATSPPAAQPAPAPPPPPSASSNSSLDILIAPSPSRSEPPTSTQLNAEPKPSSNTNSL
ncbi:MAG: protein kinase [Elainellaceae cyanobacterium]